MVSKLLDLNKNEYFFLDKSSILDFVDEGKEFVINFNKISVMFFMFIFVLNVCRLRI